MNATDAASVNTELPKDNTTKDASPKADDTVINNDGSNKPPHKMQKLQHASFYKNLRSKPNVTVNETQHSDDSTDESEKEENVADDLTLNGEPANETPVKQRSSLHRDASTHSSASQDSFIESLLSEESRWVIL